MPLIIPVGFGQVAWRWELNSDPEYIITTCGVNLAAAAGDFQAAVVGLANDMLDAWPAAGMSNQWRFRGAVLRVGQDGGPPAVYEHPQNVVGVGGANILPQNCALLVRKITASAGRRNRGRFYFPMLSVIETAVDQVGAIEPISLADLQTRCNTLHASMSSGSPASPPVILHTLVGAGAVPAPTPITSFAAEPRIATQRRRMRR